MDRAAERGAFLRFAAGTLASLLAGLAVFRLDLFQPQEPWFQCITSGALVAGVVALVRVERPAQALGLAAAFALVHVGYAWTLDLKRAVAESLWSGVLAGGAFVVSVIFDRLAVAGYRFGKFALLGPLMAGVYLAATSVLLTVPAPETGPETMIVLVRHLFVGLIVGDAVGLGVELVELLPGVGPPTSQAAVVS